MLFAFTPYPPLHPFVSYLSKGLLLRHAIVVSALVILFAGCASPALPKASYRKVDETSPEFKTAFAQETARLQAAGESARQAEKIAAKRAAKQVVQTEKEKRTAQVAPLVRSLQELDKPRGCWAYTSTTTTSKAGKITVEVARFDPFQPEDRIWTLLTRDGRAPDEHEQKEFRAEKLKRWKRTLTVEKKSRASEHIEVHALVADFSVGSRDEGRITEFSFASGRFHVPLAGGMDWRSTLYTINSDSGQLLSRRMAHGPASLFGTTKIDYFESITEFSVVDPSIAPFPARSTARYRLHHFGVDHGDIQIETTYSDYKRVKCYDDRFEVQIGMPQMQDFLPSRE
jgi:hypothetical protein